MLKKGCFITLEGGEGSGKSTQLQKLADRLRSHGNREVIATRSPGGTDIAETIRNILKTRNQKEDLLPESELLLFGVCHSQMSEKLIRPALERGAVLLSDRFYDSTLVYQGSARGLSKDFVRMVNDFSCRHLKPDLTLILDLPPELGCQRANIRAGNSASVQQDRFDSETMDFHQKVRNGFLDLARLEPERFCVIDASGTEDQVHQLIVEAVHAKLGIL